MGHRKRPKFRYFLRVLDTNFKLIDNVKNNSLLNVLRFLLGHHLLLNFRKFLSNTVCLLLTKLYRALCTYFYTN